MFGKEINDIMALTMTIIFSIIIAIIIIGGTFYVTKKAYSKKWDQQ
ncbi:hypothetical protein PASE110613_02620 [Paenibacillus sediminis]|uniref:DUF3149 domain-containing protein n=1 Tax=Paenibacillus sediminis TaxID=664909 RepID=A0ABS4GZI3_9BACL|nr:hypothetical protein [Paenibacillus sediminis]MBP1935517.1 hypothetical protein [Paenibacillus sediminis]